MTGYGQERGVVGVSITNDSPTEVEAIWLEEWPWWMRVYMHTLKLQTEDLIIQNLSVSAVPLNSIRYDSAVDRTSATLIEAKVLIPAKSRLHITIDYEKGYLRYTEYPSDAMRGFALPGAIVSYRSSITQTILRVYSATALVNMPTPDFSMPYNVIVMTSTLMALHFGTVFNSMVRKFYAVDLVKGTMPSSKLKIN